MFFGQLALLLILVDETDNAFADVYSASVSLQNIKANISRSIYVSIIGLISIILGLTIPIVEYENFLLLIGASFVPVVAILIADYFIVRGMEYGDEDLYGNKKLSVASLLVWLMGFIVYYYFAYVFPVVGASLPTFILTFLLYVLVRKFRGV